jgi:hypothetical protein
MHKRLGDLPTFDLPRLLAFLEKCDEPLDLLPIRLSEGQFVTTTLQAFE